jgi:hypothetical protein
LYFLAGAIILFAKKKTGPLTFCVDYRKLNDITIKNRYLLLRVDNIQEQLQKAVIFMQLDIKDAYYLIRVAKSEK